MQYAQERKIKKMKYLCYKCDKFMCKKYMKLIYDSCLVGKKSDHETSDKCLIFCLLHIIKEVLLLFYFLMKSIIILFYYEKYNYFILVWKVYCFILLFNKKSNHFIILVIYSEKIYNLYFIFKCLVLFIRVIIVHSQINI